MGIIDLDFQSIVIGYMVGVALMWSLCNLLYGDNDEQEQTDCKNTDGSLYTRSDNVYTCTPERMST